MVMRVLQVVTHMERGGLETMLMNYYRYIDREKIQFDFLVHRESKAAYDDEIRALGGKIYHVSRLVPWSRGYRQELREFFQQHPEYRILHVHQDCLSSVILQVAKECGISVRIAHSHNANQDKNLKYPIKLFYRRQIPIYATDLFACGEEAGDWMFQGAKYTILNNAIPAKAYTYSKDVREKLRKEFGLRDELVLGLVASFTAQKNHEFLLTVFKELLSKEPNAKLLLIGDGVLRDSIEKKIKEYGIESKVILTGVRSDVPELLQAMDLFVMPSLYEGLSLAIVEAQAASLPCIISDRIPSECIKTDLVEQISLSKEPSYWAERILIQKDRERTDRYKEIAKAGFDIQENAEWLQNYYLEKVKG